MKEDKLCFEQLLHVIQASGESDFIDMDELKQVFMIKYLNKGEEFISQGEIENEIAFVCKGLFRYYYLTQDGLDMTKHFTLENDFVTSYASLIYRRPTAYGIVAEEDSQILVMDYRTYIKKITESRQWERIARKYTEHIYNIKELREASLLLHDAKERYQDFLILYPQLEKRIRQKHIATYLGIHPVTLSRLRKKTT
jgi:CRP-like cAMP-binding protein